MGAVRLTEVTAHEWYVIDHIAETDPRVRKRMLAMGFVPGQSIKIKMTSGLFGRPKFVVDVGTARYALLHSEAEHVYVRKI